MNILILTTHLNTGGITSYLLSLTKGLRAKGHKVFLASAGGNCQSLIESYGARHINVGFQTKSAADLRIYLNLNRFKKLIIDEKIDIIHAQTRVMQVMGYFLSALTGKPLTTTCHGFFKVHFFRQIFPCWGKGVIAISKPVEDHLDKDFHVAKENVFIIPNGIDINSFTQTTQSLRIQKRNEWGINAKIVIGIIARLSEVKGIDVLIKSMPIVVKQFPDVLLMITGEGPQEEYLVSLVDQLNLKKNVRFEKIVNQTKEVLPVFDIFVMPSRQEGLGLSVMEAQACALPVIASKVGGLIDLIEDHKTGYFVEQGNSEDLAKKIIEVINNPQEALKVGVAARKQIMEHFSLEQMVDSTVKVYEKYSRC